MSSLSVGCRVEEPFEAQQPARASQEDQPDAWPGVLAGERKLAQVGDAPDDQWNGRGGDPQKLLVRGLVVVALRAQDGAVRPSGHVDDAVRVTLAGCVGPRQHHDVSEFDVARGCYPGDGEVARVQGRRHARREHWEERDAQQRHRQRARGGDECDENEKGTGEQAQHT